MMMTIKTGPVIVSWGGTLHIMKEFDIGGSFSCKPEIMNFKLNLHLFSLLQLLIIDGQQLRTDPSTVMDEVQKFLGVSPHYNYSEALT